MSGFADTAGQDRDRWVADGVQDVRIACGSVNVQLLFPRLALLDVEVVECAEAKVPRTWCGSAVRKRSTGAE
jgi:hypothetical protein